MKKREFEQLKTELESTFADRPAYRNIWYLLGYITGSVGTEFKEKAYTESQLKELIDLIQYEEV